MFIAPLKTLAAARTQIGTSFGRVPCASAPCGPLLRAARRRHSATNSQPHLDGLAACAAPHRRPAPRTRGAQRHVARQQRRLAGVERGGAAIGNLLTSLSNEATIRAGPRAALPLWSQSRRPRRHAKLRQAAPSYAKLREAGVCEAAVAGPGQAMHDTRQRLAERNSPHSASDIGP